MLNNQLYIQQVYRAAVESKVAIGAAGKNIPVPRALGAADPPASHPNLQNSTKKGWFRHFPSNK
jgi:hypothetical protein